jgi:O-antigen ligase
LIAKAASIDAVIPTAEQSRAQRVSNVLSVVIYVSLLGLIVFTAIPYGTAEAWWKAFFVCAIFSINVFWIIDGYLTGSWRTGAEMAMLPLLLLSGFAVLQTISLPGSAFTAEISQPVWNAISADPFATRFFIVQFLAVILAGAMLSRYGMSDARLQTLVHVIICVVVASALFGILRQTTQHQLGFGLPLLGVGQGFGQFINRNHFAFLMEMGFGLTLGMILGRAVSGERALLYVAALIPIWSALVLSNSRGGLLAMLAQVISAGFLFALSVPPSGRNLGALGFLVSWPARVGLLVVLLVAVAWGTLWLGGDSLVSRLEAGKFEFNPTAAELRQNARRNQIWRATWKMFAAHPIAGVGLGGYWAAIPTYHDASGTITPQEAHNDYLELLASGGLIGFACGIWFLVIVFRRVRENFQNTFGFRQSTVFGATLGIIGVAVHSLVDFGLHMLVNAVIFAALISIATFRRTSSETV